MLKSRGKHLIALPEFTSGSKTFATATKQANFQKNFHRFNI